MADRRWNHNVHYFPVVLDAIPGGARRALDVGCGEGMLTRQLRERVPEVIGLDLDEAGLALARRQNDEITYVRGDFLTCPFEPGSFDLISMVATLHHMDLSAALARARELLRPGGVLCVIGLARGRPLHDIHIELAAAVTHRFHAWRNGVWQHPSPVQAPSETYAEMRRISDEALPGSHFRRRVLWRYSLIWAKARD